MDYIVSEGRGYSKTLSQKDTLHKIDELLKNNKCFSSYLLDGKTVCKSKHMPDARIAFFLHYANKKPIVISYASTAIIGVDDFAFSDIPLRDSLTQLAGYHSHYRKW